MKKTKITFEDIKAGDLLEVVLVDNGVKSVLTGIAFNLDTLWEGDERVHRFWATSDGGMIIADEEVNAVIYRIDVVPVKFEDIKEGDLVRVTRTENDVVKTIAGVASYRSDHTSNNYWVTASGQVLVYRLQMPNETIEILERGE